MNIVYKLPLLTLATCATLYFAPWLAPQLTPIETCRAGWMAFWGFGWFVVRLGEGPKYDLVISDNGSLSANRCRFPKRF